MRSQISRPRGRSANIFINYRREDSSGHAGRLFDALSAHFAGRLFMDVDTLEPGVDFVEAIEQAVGSCEVLIVVIGREWLTIENTAGHRRLDDPADFVRLEVESALARKIRVIPVLVQDAPMPRAEELPPSLARLARRNAIELSDARWAYDVDRLARTIQDILEKQEVSAPAPALPPERTMPSPAAIAPAVAAKTAGTRVWLFSLAALVLVAAVGLASVSWLRRPPAKVESTTAAPLVDLTAGSPVRVEPTATPVSDAVGTTSPSTTRQEAPAVERANDEPEPHRKALPIKIPVDVEPAPPTQPIETVKIPVADPPAVNPASTADVQPPRFTIMSPASGERVGDSVQVQGVVLHLGDRRAFLCIRQKNGVIYPRGELFPDDGQFSIQLRSSREKTFEILVVTAASKEAAQVLSDQRSRDDGMPVLPAGASISSAVVTLKRQGKIRDFLSPG